ncbi:Bur2 protein [Candida orthopsilosis Co 90-125]|uniref:Bur2 protein n=1 Tax=Candida orthopsilosis (strain 90-125) TaxID=1136231 RepID=H8X967_CANO9|nr:Bur2 protein [Candida orthopsilosis Co 90-125]CCG24366.1 Bur2 protein [Candida orthopsilosis Co 90-125]
MIQNDIALPPTIGEDDTPKSRESVATVASSHTISTATGPTTTASTTTTTNNNKHKHNNTSNSSSSHNSNANQIHSQSKSIWIFPESQVLNRTPSRIQSRITLPQELRIKESMHEFVIRLGTKLKVDGPTLLATTVYLHRYYMRLPLSSSKYYVTSAALTIACKLNDNYRQPDKVSLYACNVKNPHPPVIKDNVKLPPPPIDEQNEYYWKWRDQLLYREELILRKLQFNLNFTSPYLLQFKISNKMHLGMGHLLYNKRKDILKMTTTLIELLSSLPIILCYDMKEIFATCFVITIVEGKSRFDKDLQIPENFLPSIIGVDVDVALHCFQFIKKLLHCSQGDSHVISNKAAAKRLLPIKSHYFEDVARGK